MYYAGARYYNPKWSIWLSVDPLAEFYPNWSPYNYVLNNPVKLIDPNGMSPIQPPGGGMIYYSLDRSILVAQEYLYLRATTNKGSLNAYLTASYRVFKGDAQFVFDIAGLIPVYGEVFDGINAAWYALEGEYFNASLSAAAMLPLVGWGATGTKWLVKGFNISDSSASLVKSVGKATENSKEVIMKTFSNTFRDAKKLAQDITKVGDDAPDYITRVDGSPFNNKVTGKTDGKNYWRVDVDKNTGEAHINWQVGKKKGRIDFGGGERNANSIIDNVLNN